MQAGSHYSAADYLNLERWALETPGATALTAPGREPLAYSALWDHVRAASEALRQAGVRPGNVVVLALPNGPEFVTAVLAITLESACAPLDLNLTKDEYRFFLTRLDASTLICQEGAHTPAVEVARELGMRLVHIRSSQELPAGVFSMGNVESPTEARPSRLTDAALLFHTSATTNAPKLVPRSRWSLRAAAEQDARAHQLSAADRFLSLMPLCYGHGISALFSQLICGGSVFCAPAFEAESFLAWLAEFRPTWFSASPAMHRIIATLARENPEAFQRIALRFVRSVGAPLETDLLLLEESLLGVPVLDGYGMTEAPSITRNTPSQRKPGSVGRSAGPDIAVLDESGETLPPETEGEIAVRGLTVMSGYLDNPDATAAAFHGKWFRTGDIGRLDHDGFLFIVGRRKEMINRGGSKILPQEVDNALATHPALADVACFAIPHRSLGEDVAAAVVLRPGAEISELELRRYAAERIAAHKVPRRIVFAERIPRTTTGKPKRRALTEQFRNLLAPVVPCSLEADRPPTEVETQIIDVWRRILGVGQIGADDDFFDLGGDSLSAALMLAELEKAPRFRGHLLDGSDFFDKPTVASLARIIAQGKPGRIAEDPISNRILWLRKGGSRNPFFCFSHSELNPHQFHQLARWLSPDQPFVVVCPPPASQDGRLLKMEEIARQSAASIRALRAHGPYLIGGYCYGGVVAFEAARQLLEEGAEVPLLALFDTPTPGYPKIVHDWRRFVHQGHGMLLSLAQASHSVTVKNLAAHLRALGRIAARRYMAKARRSLLAAGIRTPRGDESDNSVARREYAPRLLSAPIVHFIGADVAVSTEVLSDPRLGWRDFAGGGFEARPIPGDHVSIFSPANAPVLARELERAIQAAESASRRDEASYAAAVK